MPEHDLELVVSGLEPVAERVLQLTLQSRELAELPAWEPGAHIDLHFVSGGVDYVRQYSLCGRTSDRRRWQVAVLLVSEGRGGSAHIHESFSRGQIVRVTGPRNNFPIVPASSYLFIAGGIGITPIISMIAAVSSLRIDWHLLYCGRSRESMAFVDHLAEYESERIQLHRSDTHGLADLASIITTTDPATAIYCCGPESMLRTVEESCASHPNIDLHMERFSPAEQALGGKNTAFEVEFARSGIVVTVPADRSILEVAEEAGVDIDSSCQEGVCSTCETKVISGIPDHRDSVLSAKEREAGQSMMVCVSRSFSPRLVLDA